jgi:hypothetical protein
VGETDLTFVVYGVTSYSLPFTPPADQWIHVAVAYDSSNDAHFYVNGELEGTVPGILPARPNTQDLVIARGAAEDAGGWGYVAGGLDEVAVYGQALGLAEIMEHYVEAIGATRGDADLDDDVDFVDFNALADNYTGVGGSGMAWCHGDFDFDGDVDFTDFNHIANNYTGSLGGSKAVPEPSALALLCVAVVAFLPRVLRRR